MTFGKTLETGERALANAIAMFFATLIMGFLLWMVVEPAATPLLDTAGEQTSRESSQQGQNYVSYAVSNMHFIVVGFGVLQLIVAAVWESRMAGGGRV